MLFHNYIETLFGSKVKVKVLRTLWRFKEKEFTIRELAKFLGISHTGVKKALDDLEKQMPYGSGLSEDPTLLNSMETALEQVL